MITYKIIKLVASSAAEAELGAIFVNTKEARILWLTLQELGHPQPQTPIHGNNTTVIGILNNMIKQQRSLAMEMQYYWLLYQMAPQYFKFYYQPDLENLADYHTKHHLWQIHQNVQPYYIQWQTRQQNFYERLNQVYGESMLESWEIPIYDKSHYHGFPITENLA